MSEIHKDQEWRKGVIGRRDFLKWGGVTFGLSASGLGFWLSQSQAAEAQAIDVTGGLVGYWKLDETGGEAVPDAVGGNVGALKGGTGWSTGKAGGAVLFNGSDAEINVGKNVLDTSGSYSVSAWVQLCDKNSWSTAVSQDGNAISGFFLQYTSPSAPADAGRFAFSTIDSDSTGGAITRAISPFSPTTNTWYHLVGVHDSGSNQIKLYVNGALVSTKSVPGAWKAGGGVAIGRAKWNGGSVDHWPGKIDEVRLYNRALSDQDVRDVFSAAPHFSPVRPPAVPLAVRNPYNSTWQMADNLNGDWPKFWTSGVKAMTGIARIDGNAYVFMGSPVGIGTTQNMTQMQVEVTATQSRYTFQGGGVTLNLTFFSPVEPNDLQKQSVPYSYIFAQAYSNDGNTHNVNLYFDISAEWAHGDVNQQVKWGAEQVGHSGGNLQTFTMTPNSPNVLAEFGDYPSWGTVVWATNSQSNLTYQSGADNVVRGLAVSQGTLNNTNDGSQPRAIKDRWPVFGFSFNLGNLGGQPIDPIVLTIGHVREPAVSYLGNGVAPLWRSYWSNWQAMLGAFYDDFSGALSRGNTLDHSLAADAVTAGGANYAAICNLALRQAFGGTELVGTSQNPWMFLKEISSDGNVSTIDVMYPGMPVFVYTNPYLLRLLLEPLLAYAETGGWPKTFAEHDIGSSYPNAAGHNDGNEEDMPVEESANMLLMSLAYMNGVSSGEASAWANSHYKILKQWADYLVQNALDPNLQNQTDDFTGFIAHSSNLALKGILGVYAMGNIANAVGNGGDTGYYHGQGSSMITQWVSKSQDSSGQHLKLAYDQDGTWSLKYNAYPDKLLGLNLIPNSVIQEEDNWYKTKEATYGIPLDNRHGYTKADWEMWTAGSTEDGDLRQFFIDALYRFANDTTQRVPFSDWYETGDARQAGFQARPVVGGLFSILARRKSGH